MGSGKISCCCLDCDGDMVPVTAFEEHSGTSERHLSDGIHLSNHGVTLKACFPLPPLKISQRMLTIKQCQIQR